MRGIGWIIAGLVWSFASTAAAQEDTEDRGSRATRGAHKSDVELGYSAAAFAGAYVQDPRFGPLLDLSVDAGFKRGDQRLSGKLGYLYEPFSTKSFNFADEDQTQDGPTVEERLAQPMHEISFEPRWRAKWSPTFRTRSGLDLNARFPQFPSDKRYAAYLRSTGRWGKLRGPFAELQGRLFAKKFPNYLVADRRIDQNGFSLSPGGGYVFEDKSEIALHYEVELTNYIDARYDMLDANGAVVRADKSKDYIDHSVQLDGDWRATSWLRLRARYEWRLNDSVHYDREMTGRDAAGALDAHFIPDYYDYTRHRFEVRAATKFGKKLEVDLVAEYWFRDFKTYEARDVDNLWTGELRHDNSVEVGLEAAYELASFGSAVENVLYATAFASHLHRDSNMRREVSFATNYDITRVFAGVELRSR